MHRFHSTVKCVDNLVVVMESFARPTPTVDPSTIARDAFTGNRYNGNNRTHEESFLGCQRPITQ